MTVSPAPADEYVETWDTEHELISLGSLRKLEREQHVLLYHGGTNGGLHRTSPCRDRSTGVSGEKCIAPALAVIAARAPGVEFSTPAPAVTAASAPELLQ